MLYIKEDLHEIIYKGAVKDGWGKYFEQPDFPHCNFRFVKHMAISPTVCGCKWLVEEAHFDDNEFCQ